LRQWWAVASSIDPTKLLATVPAGLRKPLLQEYQGIVSNFAEHRWEPSELSGGKFCECVYWICHGFVTGTYKAKPSKPSNMRDDCRAIENMPNSGKAGDRGIRILIPRLLPGLYEIRNNRGVGHVGGDVDPNMMDAAVVHSMTSWIMGELIRVFHNIKTDEAQEAVDGLSERKLTLIWSPGTAKRVLDTGLDASDQTLLLLHQALSWVSDADLLASVEYSTMSNFRKNVLRKLHKARMLEHDQSADRARISPKGSEHVEKTILAPRLGWKTKA
jgi:hypothetical protein